MDYRGGVQIMKPGVPLYGRIAGYGAYGTSQGQGPSSNNSSANNSPGNSGAMSGATTSFGGGFSQHLLHSQAQPRRVQSRPPSGPVLSGTATPPALPPVPAGPEAVCVNSADVENVCREMDEQKVLIDGVEIISVSGGKDGEAEYVLWGIRFQGGTTFQFPGTGSRLKFQSREQPTAEPEVPPPPAAEEAAPMFVQITAATRAAENMEFPKYMMDDDMSHFIYG